MFMKKLLSIATVSALAVSVLAGCGGSTGGGAAGELHASGCDRTGRYRARGPAVAAGSVSADSTHGTVSGRVEAAGPT